MSASVLFVGLDAYDAGLARQWAKEGALPNLARFLAHWQCLETRLPVGVYSASVWPTLNSGLPASEHGCYFRRVFDPANYLDVDMPQPDLGGDALWDRLSAAGCRVAVIDAPHTAVSPGINGFQLVNWSGHDPEPMHTSASDAALLQELRRRFGQPPLDRCEDVELDPQARRELCEELLARIDNKQRMASYLLQSRDWDLFYLVFGEAHCAGHQLWHTHEGQSVPDSQEDLLKPVYMRLDRALGELVATDDVETVIVTLSHGMESAFGEAEILEQVLNNLPSGTGLPESGRGVYRSVRRAFMRMPQKYRWHPWLQRPKAALRALLQRQTLARHRAALPWFFVPTNMSNPGFRLNLKGREAHGLVEPCAEEQYWLDFLRNHFQAITVNGGKERLVKAVYVMKEHAESTDKLPDLCIEWNREIPITSIEMPDGTVLRPRVHARTGDHRPVGMFMLSAAAPRLATSGKLPIEDVAGLVMDLVNAPAATPDDARRRVSMSAANCTVRGPGA